MKRYAAGLAALTILRLVMAATTPLAPDEAYYWIWSRALSPGYPDHPPMVALWIRAGTWLAGDGALGVRLLGPLAVALASVLLVDAGESLLPGRRAGLCAAVLLNASLLFGVGAVVMTPDTPLLFFWTGCLWALGRLVRSGNSAWWPAVGALAGLALASKYTAVFLWLGIALWLLATPERRWLARPAPWAAALLGAAIMLPVVLWNAAHGWASIARQGRRVGEFQPGRSVRFLGELIGGQIGLATPLVFLLCAAGVVTAVRLAWRTRDPAWTLLAALTLPAVLVFVEHALGDRVQGNWPSIIYPAAAIAAAGLTAPAWRRLHMPAAVLGIVITLCVYAQASFALLPLPAGLVDPIALRLAGWDALAAQVETARRHAGARFVAVDQYAVAAELARTLPPDVPVVGVEPRWALFDLPAAALTGQTGILVSSARDTDAIGPAVWSDVAAIGQAERGHDGSPVETFRLFRVTGRTGPSAAVVLPRSATIAECGFMPMPGALHC